MESRAAIQAAKFHGDTLKELGRLEEAERILRRAYGMARQRRGAHDTQTLEAANSLALVLQARELYGQAEEILLEVIDVHTRLSGESHPKTRTALNNLAVQYLREDRHEQAEQIFRKLVANRPRSRTTSTFEFRVRHNLALVLQLQGRDEQLAEAERIARELIRDSERVLPEGNWMIAMFHRRLGVCLGEQGRFAEAEHELAPAAEALEKELGSGHETTRDAFGNLAQLYGAWGKPDEVARIRARYPTEDGESVKR